MRKNLEDLEDPLAEPAWQDELRQTVAPWRSPAEVRVRDELLRQKRRWRATRPPDVPPARHEARFWRALAVLLAVQEPVSEETLRALGLWSEWLGAVLHHCASLFGRRPVDAVEARTTPYVFDHPAYARVLARDPANPDSPSGAMAVVTARHRQLARGCRRWRTLTGPARTYALRHLLAHGQAAEQWNQYSESLLDIAYVDTRIAEASTIDQLLSDVTRALNVLPRPTTHTRRSWQSRASSATMLLSFSRIPRCSCNSYTML